uniref:Uncharacterized protein n=1 Tax=Ditylenchus dipsaci TaxID=166011 RepID=A0A915DX88_9BILA
MLSTPDGTKQYWQCEKNLAEDGGCKTRLHTYVDGNRFIQMLGCRGQPTGQVKRQIPVAQVIEPLFRVIESKGISAKTIILDKVKGDERAARNANFAKVGKIGEFSNDNRRD